MAVPLSPLTAMQAAANVESPAALWVDALGSWAERADAPGGTALVEAARQSLRHFFDKLLAYEEAVLADEKAKNIHQMRVTTRRLRASLLVLEGVFEQRLIRRYRRGLRRVAQALGAVRDGDVFLAHIVSYRKSLPKGQRSTLAPLVAAVTVERERARQGLLKKLTGKGYAKFKRSFSAFLNTPGKGALPSPEPGVTQRVRDFAGSAIWRRYELLRTYETVLQDSSDETLHQARIAGKYLRYTIELFADALGAHATGVLKPLIALQNGLGALQDGITAREHIAALGLAGDSGAQDYLVAGEAKRVELQARRAGLWAHVAGATYQRRLFKLIIGM